TGAGARTLIHELARWIETLRRSGKRGIRPSRVVFSGAPWCGRPLAVAARAAEGGVSLAPLRGHDTLVRKSRHGERGGRTTLRRGRTGGSPPSGKHRGPRGRQFLPLSSNPRTLCKVRQLVGSAGDARPRE